MPVVGAPVIRVPPEAVMEHVQVIGRPPDGEGSRYAPEVIVVKVVTVRVRVVVHGVRAWMIVIHRSWLHDDDTLRFVVGHIDNLFAGRCDFDHTVIVPDDLAIVGLQVAGRVGAVAKCLDGGDHLCLLAHDSFAESPRPVEVVVHECNDLRVVQQRRDRIVPVVARLQTVVSLEIFEETRGLHDLEGIRGSR